MSVGVEVKKKYPFIYSKILRYIMVADKPLKISGATKKGLDSLKIHPRETYDDVICRLVEEEEERNEKRS